MRGDAAVTLLLIVGLTLLFCVVIVWFAVAIDTIRQSRTDQRFRRRHAKPHDTRWSDSDDHALHEFMDGPR